MKIDYLETGYNKYESGRFEEAIVDLTKAIKSNHAEIAECYYVRSVCYQNLQDFSNSIQDLTSAIKINPKKSDYFSTRGYAYNILAQREKAMADLDEAIRLDPQNYIAYNNRGITKKNSRNFREKYEYFNCKNTR